MRRRFLVNGESVRCRFAVEELMGVQVYARARATAFLYQTLNQAETMLSRRSQLS